MKTSFTLTALFCILLCSCNQKAETSPEADVKEPVSKKLFIDVHELGEVAFADVAEAHKKDLATQEKYDVNFIKYWVDEKEGKVYCLSEATDPELISKTHKEAHGLVPARIHVVSDGPEASLTGKQLYWDIHKLGPGNVTAQAVADAHDKDLAVQGKYDVNFINYWVDETEGVVMCLSEAPDSSAVIKTHTEAHGLVPHEIGEVQQGN